MLELGCERFDLLQRKELRAVPPQAGRMYLFVPLRVLVHQSLIVTLNNVTEDGL